ncbi:MAG: heparan N-sulfatase [Cyclobacteriaceae bacterium]|nr:MAG: heparan N-sulfatase [Cyclobacteriaceae bacterium]
MIKVDSLIILLIAVLIACSSEHEDNFENQPAAKNGKKNIVLFVSDDHGKTAGCYGNPVIKTPNMDQLAAEGTLFTNAFATTASCTASRSVILTGLHNHHTGLYGHMHFPFHFRAYENLKSLPVMLNQGGYRTGTVGKYHVAPKEVFDFETFISTDDLGQQVDYGRANFGRNTVMMADACQKFINAQDQRPFFLYFCTSDPHRSSDEDHPNRFGNQDDGFEGVTPITYKEEDVIVPAFLPDTRESREELAQYYQSVSRVDQGLGRLIQHLKDAGVYENTLIIYMSDHGMAFPGAKTTTYDPGLNSPLIVRKPGVQKRGITTNAMVSWTDITPTILDFAGVAAPFPYVLESGAEGNPNGTISSFDGRSFLDILEEEAPEGFDEVYASHTFHEIQMYYPMRVVRDRNYKLIWNIAWQLPYPFASDLWAAQTWQAQFKLGMDAPYGKRTVGEYIQRPQFELYDVANDPHEENNLALNPLNMELLATYQAKIKSFQEKTGDRWVLKWEYQ